MKYRKELKYQKRRLILESIIFEMVYISMFVYYFIR